MANHHPTVAVDNDTGQLRVKGMLTFATVPTLAALSKTWTVPEDKPIVIDFSDVSHSDSAGLALMLQWLSDVRAAGGDLKFINIPDQVEDFIRINGLAELLIN